MLFFHHQFVFFPRAMPDLFCTGPSRRFYVEYRTQIWKVSERMRFNRCHLPWQWRKEYIFSTDQTSLEIGMPRRLCFSPFGHSSVMSPIRINNGLCGKEKIRSCCAFLSWKSRLRYTLLY
jgi:hypothetical protein